MLDLPHLPIIWRILESDGTAEKCELYEGMLGEACLHLLYTLHEQSPRRFGDCGYVHERVHLYNGTPLAADIAFHFEQDGVAVDEDRLSIEGRILRRLYHQARGSSRSSSPRDA